MSINDYEILKELGKGAFGTVCRVRRKADGGIYAMKRVKISALSAKERDNALNEVRILASLSHQNIIGYKDSFFEDSSKTLNIVMELADDGDLESKIQGHIKNRTNFSENEIWNYLIQMTSGLKALHDNKIMHRDLKCANIFVMKDGTLKLGDLNVSKVVKMQLAYTQTGTPYYASPEVWSDKPYDYKSDLWSVGAVIYELCALSPPFKGNSLQDLYRNIMKGVYNPIPTKYSKELSTIIGYILQVNPANRPNCDTLLNNPLIVKRIDFAKNCGKAQVNLIGTIKMPRNLKDINMNLPKGKFNQDDFLFKPPKEEIKREEIFSQKNEIKAKPLILEEKKNQGLNRLGSDRNLVDKPVKQVNPPNQQQQYINYHYKPNVAKPNVYEERKQNRPGSSKPDSGSLKPNPINPYNAQNQVRNSIKKPEPNNYRYDPVKNIGNMQQKIIAPVQNNQQKYVYNRPVSSKVDNKIIANHQHARVEVRKPEPKIIGRQIKISEKIVKAAGAGSNVRNNVYNNNQLLRNVKQPEPVKLGPRIAHIKK